MRYQIVSRLWLNHGKIARFSILDTQSGKQAGIVFFPDTATLSPAQPRNASGAAQQMNRALALPARHEGQPLEQMHVLLVLQQCAV